MPNPVLKASVPEGLYRRAQDEAERIGIDLPEYVRQAMAVVLDAPRRREDFLSMTARLDELEARLARLERTQQEAP